MYNHFVFVFCSCVHALLILGLFDRFCFSVFVVILLGYVLFWWVPFWCYQILMLFRSFQISKSKLRNRLFNRQFFVFAQQSRIASLSFSLGCRSFFHFLLLFTISSETIICRVLLFSMNNFLYEGETERNCIHSLQWQDGGVSKGMRPLLYYECRLKDATVFASTD